MRHEERQRRGPAIAPAVPAAVLLAALAACGGGQDPVADTGGFRDLPSDHVALDLFTDIKDMGALRARLHADTAYIWEDSARTVMFPVDLRLYDENGAETAHLTADEGHLDSETNNMFARGNVVLVSTDDERRILTEELHYDPRRGRIWSDVHTVLFEGDSRLEGSGFQANSDMTEIEVYESRGENIQIEF
ncbi:MAG: LPS export ABC transporter periplasmic protein LptC [Gemmatimonadota bacterium]